MRGKAVPQRVRLCSAKFGVLALSEGDAFRAVALHGAPPAYAEVRRREPVMRFGPGTATSHVAKMKQPVQIADIRAEPAYANDPLACMPPYQFSSDPF